MIISKTPYRISFLGGGTDYPAWYRSEGGAVLSTTIDKYCYITCRRLPPFFTDKHRIVWSKIELTSKFADITHPAIREALRHLGFPEHEGVEIHHQGDLPARSGMGTSSSFVVGLLKALAALQGRMLCKEDLARDSIRFEQEILREDVGSQDQVAAAFGGLNLIHFRADGGFTVEPVILPHERREALNDRLHLFFTGTDRISATIARDIVSNIPKSQPNLRRLRALVDDGLRALTGGNGLDDFGELLHQAWAEKRQLSPLVTNPEVDDLYARARANGALGGKLLGAGRSGFMLFYVPLERREAFRSAMCNYLEVPFRFESAGSVIVHHTPEV